MLVASTTYAEQPDCGATPAGPSHALTESHDDDGGGGYGFGEGSIDGGAAGDDQSGAEHVRTVSTQVLMFGSSQ